jgi:hypothetical protein
LVARLVKSARETSWAGGAEHSSEEARMDWWMSAFSIAIIVAVVVVMGMFLFTVVTSGRFTRVTGAVTRSFWCPYVERRVTAEMQEHVRDDRAVDVVWCTAFKPAVTVRCGKPCLRAPGFMRPLSRPLRTLRHAVARRH